MPEQYLLSLKCGSCSREFPLDPIYICEYDFGKLSIQYDYNRIRENISKEKIERRAPNMWRYMEFLPINSDKKPEHSLDTGYTPLIKSQNLAKVLGVGELYLKDERGNPTHSFKDRVVETAVAKAKEFGYRVIACASTGNLANSLAAHAARAGLECYIFVPHDLEREKITGTLIFNPKLIGVKGVYDEVNRLCSEISQSYRKIAFANISLRPYYGDGSKTLGFEVAEQLGWKAPAHIVVPVAGASLITKIHKAFNELYLAGLIKEPKTRMYAAQADGCSPVANAIIANEDIIKPIPHQKINTIAKSIAIGNPADGEFALNTIKKSNGYAAAVSDEEIVEGIQLLAETEGIWTETAGGVVVASAKKLINEGKLPANDGSIVLCITGDGYKTPNVILGLDLTTVIGPKLQEFRDFYATLEQRAEQYSKPQKSLG